MSNINIQRAVENIRSTTTVFTPIVEMVVNAVQAIEAAGEARGQVLLRLRRAAQQTLGLDDKPPRIVDILISDNGIGFNKENRASFDTLYSDQKIKDGGKGFGRLTSLRYFDDLHVDSVYREGEKTFKRSFDLGKRTELIVNETEAESTEKETGTTITLKGVKSESLPQKVSTISRGLVELLLPYFTTSGYACPKIQLSEFDGADAVVLNDYVDSQGAIIQEVGLEESSFSLDSFDGPQEFRVRVFKFFSPSNKASKVSLVAHKREVTETPLATYIPEFADEFQEDPGGDRTRRRNFILKAYVFSPYLDANVELERGAFKFQKDSDAFYRISQTEIERHVAELTKATVADEVQTRQEKKRERLQGYVEAQAPWYKPLMRELDISQLPPTAGPAEMDVFLHREKYKQEQRINLDVATVLASADPNQLAERARELANRVSESSKNELVHYVALRKQVLELFKRSLEFKDDETFETEGAVHDIIFPTKTDGQEIAYQDHNLWILDERLTFTSYLASDMPLEGGRSQRPDIIAFDSPVAFRANNEASNAVTIFEFKRPGRHDFADLSSKEDPIEQIHRYVIALRAGKFLTPKGRPIAVAETTPFYGYVVCDLNQKVKDWLKNYKDFKPMPDGSGYFNWRTNVNLYIEVLDWSKVYKDADIRNKVFFHKLGIHTPEDRD
jgi:hypothetical protein